MYKRLPPLNSLKYFESAARHLSFTLAADELCVTQAAVSHQVKLLEDYLGISLFLRKNRALELTDLGKAYFVDVTKVLHRLADGTEKILLKKGEKHLTISVPQTFGIQWLVPHLSEFNQQYPDIEVRVKGMDHDENLLDKDTDIAIYYGKGNWKNLHTEKLAEGELFVLASPKLLHNNPIHHKNDLKNHTLIHIGSHDNWQNLADYLQLEELDAQQGSLFSHTFMALQAAIHAQGIVLANKILAQQEIENGNLQIVLQPKLRDPKSFYVVTDFDRMNDEKIFAFRQWLTLTMEQHNE